MGDIDAARRAVHALRLLVILAVLLAVTAGLRPAEARDCRDETPLPADVKLIAPGPDIAPEAARFAGAWTGAWKEQDTDTLCATLVVEELLPSGHARVIYGHGTWGPLGIRCRRTTGLRVASSTGCSASPCPCRIGRPLPTRSQTARSPAPFAAAGTMR